MSGKIIVQKENNVSTLCISNPGKKNAISYQMWLDIADYMISINDDNEVRVLILVGEGEDFSSGADISEFSDLRSGDKKELYDNAVVRAMKLLKNLKIPVIAHIKGVCYGGGFALALCCDFRFSHPMASFSLPVAKRGLGYSTGGIQNLIEVAGITHAKDILFTGRKIGVQEAEKMGITMIINNHLKNPLDSYVMMLSENAPLSIQAIKAGFQTITGVYDDQISLEERIKMCAESKDYKEATNAFLEKRNPRFTGK